MKDSFLFSLILGSLLFGCSNDDNSTSSNSGINKVISPITVNGLKFIGEQVIPDDDVLNGNKVGGLSGIDYTNNSYYLISDDPKAPIRYYTADLVFNEKEFTSVKIKSEVELLDKNNSSFAVDVDPESLRVDGNEIIWVSEGNVNNKVNPFVRSANLDGTFKKEFDTPIIFNPNDAKGKGPKHNGVFESLSLSIDGNGYWVGMELPIAEDGEKPIFANDTESPVRITYIDKATGKSGKQFAYELDKVTREVIGTGFNFTVNGLVELLEYDTDKFLALERSFTTGSDDGGNNVTIYKVNATNATDVSSFTSLKGATYTTAIKTPLFDFESIRSQLSPVEGSNKKIVDNIEGITFGPDFSNGNKSLVVVADNNFSAFGKQLNQFVVFEVLP